MAQDINIANDLYDLLATHNFDVEAADKSGNPVGPEDARIFKFDWVSASGKNYGTAVIVIGEEDELMLFFGDNLGKGMEEPDKSEWYAFLQQLANFSTRHGFHTFSPKNLNQLRHTMTGLAAIKEGLFESYYGTRRVSYMGEPTDARLVINHNRVLGEDDKRYRYVESLFIETADGEKFKMQFRNLSGGRAMLEHVRQGGKPYDVRGQHITEIVQEMSVLARFNRASRDRVFEGVTQQLVEQAQQYYHSLQNNLKHLGSARGYKQYFESWSPTDSLEGEALVEDLKTMFVEQTLDARIEAALPTLAKLQQQGERMKEAEIFESWANRLVEGTWALPDTPEAQAKLNDLMSKELIVGPDATNATEQLYDVIGDDQLFDLLNDLAERDPRANIWDDTDVQKRLQELGIQLPTQTPTPDQQQAMPPAADATAPMPATQPPVAEDDSLRIGSKLPQSDTETFGLEKGRGYKINNPKDWKPGDRPRAVQQLIPTQDKKDHIRSRLGKHAAPNLPEQAVAENTELAAILKHAGVPVAESRIHENSEYTYEKVAKILAREKPGMATNKNNPDFYNAVYHELIAIGMTPRASRNLISYDEDFISDVASAYAHYQKNPGLDEESNSGMIMPEADPMDTFEVMSGFDAPVAEGSCNMTAEGEYCPEHGLAECGGMYEEENQFGPAATAAIQQGKPPTEVHYADTGDKMNTAFQNTLMKEFDDPINRNDAITGSYYESDELARIKSLALLK